MGAVFWEEEMVVPGFLLSDAGNVESCAWAVFLCLQRVLDLHSGCCVSGSRCCVPEVVL